MDFSILSRIFDAIFREKLRNHLCVPWRRILNFRTINLISIPTKVRLKNEVEAKLLDFLVSIGYFLRYLVYSVIYI